MSDRMTCAWMFLLTASVAALAWHEVSAHSLRERLLRLPVTPTAHHETWTGLDAARKAEIRGEMLTLGVAFASVAALWPRPALAFAAGSGVLAISMRGRRR